MLQQHLSEKLLSHPVFSEIEKMNALYEHVFNASYNFVVPGTNFIGNYASHLYLSMSGTLDSISVLLKKGRINDAFVLCRKYFDDILVDLYFDIKSKEVDYLKGPFVVEDIDSWVNNRFRVPSVKKILNLLKKSSLTRDLYPFFGWNTYLEKNRQFLDDRVHGNRYNSFLYNCSELYLKKREQQMNNIAVILKQLIRLHLAFLFILNPYYFIASDYLDSLEMGCTPPEGSENWVAPFAQEAFDYYVKPDKQLAEFIKEHIELDL